MPVEPPELTAHFTVAGPSAAHDAARAAAAPTGTAREGGPGETLLSGRRGDVLAALGDAVQAALDAGAHTIDVRLEAPAGARP
jgi:hypothetical protein